MKLLARRRPRFGQDSSKKQPQDANIATLATACDASPTTSLTEDSHEPATPSTTCTSSSPLAMSSTTTSTTNDNRFTLPSRRVRSRPAGSPTKREITTPKEEPTASPDNFLTSQPSKTKKSDKFRYSLPFLAHAQHRWQQHLHVYFPTTRWRSPSSVKDAWRLFCEMFWDLLWPSIQKARLDLKQRHDYYCLVNYPYTDEANNYQKVPVPYFWTSRTALILYGQLLLALLVPPLQSLLLLSMAVFVFTKIALFCLKWTVYFVDDNNDLVHLLQFVNMWLRRFLREGERILKKNDAIRYVLAFSMVRTIPTGFAYVRYILRYKAHTVNVDSIATLEQAILDFKPPTKYQRVKKQVQSFTRDQINKLKSSTD